MNRIASAMFATALALLVAALTLGIGVEPVELLVPYHLVPVAWGICGLLIASRHASNPVGWLFLGIAILDGLIELGEAYVLRGAAEGLPGDEMAEWLLSWIWMPSLLLLTFVLVLFPEGRWPSGRWRVVPVLALAGCALGIPGQALSPRLGDDLASGENPLAVAGPLSVVLSVPGIALVIGTLLAAVVSLVVRFRRTGGVERQQLKWFVGAASLFGVALLVSSPFWQTKEIVAEVLVAVTIPLIPIAACIAILRYRLYDIDVVINRTLVYGGLTISLGATYLGLVLLAGLAVGESDLAIAASTLAVAALVRPARSRIQGLVDRRFDRRKYDAKRTLEAFSSHLRDQVDLDALDADLRAVVSDTMQPAHVSLWLRASRGAR